MRLFFLLLLFCFSVSSVAQQRMTFGFKTGLNYSGFTGDLESAERYEYNLGFHIGMIVRYHFTDLFGVKGELLYSQKGGKYFYEGPSFFRIQRSAGVVLASGIRNMNINISNDYIDFPIMGFVKLGPVELSGGINFGILVTSAGGGQLEFSSQQPLLSPFTLILDYRYLDDEAGQALNDEVIEVQIGGERVSIPGQVGAYYEYEEKHGSRFEIFDIGINAGLAFYLNQGLFLNFRGNYGLKDITRPSMDIIYSQFTGNYPTLQNVVDKQISFQASIGFSF